MSKEVMKLALEALECTEYPQDHYDAITALREALAEQPAQQEPVGRLKSDPDEGHVFVPRIDGDWSMLGKDLYTSPPAQRTWVGLTDEELSEVYNQADWDTVNGWEYERAIEAKLRSKNNG